MKYSNTSMSKRNDRRRKHHLLIGDQSLATGASNAVSGGTGLLAGDCTETARDGFRNAASTHG